MDKLNSITVKSGDNLWYIATEQVKQNGSTSAADIAKAWNKIINYNQDKGGLKNPDLIYAGDEILLPLEFAMEEIAKNIEDKTAEYDTALTNNSANLETIAADLQAMYEELEELYNECETKEQQAQITSMMQVIDIALDPNYTPSANATATDTTTENSSELAEGKLISSKDVTYCGTGVDGSVKYYKDANGKLYTEDQVDFGDKAPASSKTQEELKNDLVETATIGLYALMTNDWVENEKASKEDKVNIATSYLTGLSNEELKSIVKNLKDKLGLSGKKFDDKIKEIFGEEGFKTLEPYLSGEVETESQEYSDENLYEMQMNIWKNSLYPEIHYNVIQDLLATMTQDEKAAFKAYFDANNDVTFEEYMATKTNEVIALSEEDESLQSDGENHWKITFLNDIHALVEYADSDLSVLKSANEMTPEEQEQVTKELYFEMIDTAIRANNTTQIKQVVDALFEEKSYDILAYVSEQYKARWGEDITDRLTDDTKTRFSDAINKAKTEPATKFSADSVNGARLRMIDTATECNTWADEEATTGRDNNITEDDIWSNQTWLRAMMNLSDEDLIAINQMWGSTLSDQIKQGLNIKNKEFSETQLNTFLARLEKLGIGEKYDIEKTNSEKETEEEKEENKEESQATLQNEYAYGMASWLYSSMAYSGTDESTVLLAFEELEKNGMLKQVADAYKELYGISLKEEIEDEFDASDDKMSRNELIEQLENASDSKPKTLTKDDVYHAWYKAFMEATAYYGSNEDGGMGTNNQELRRVVLGLSYENLSGLIEYHNEIWKNDPDKQFDAIIKSETDGDLEKILLSASQNAQNYTDKSKMSNKEKEKEAYIDSLAMQLFAAKSGNGTNLDMLETIFGLDPEILYAVEQRYNEKYTGANDPEDDDYESLEDMIKSEGDISGGNEEWLLGKLDKAKKGDFTVPKNETAKNMAKALYVAYDRNGDSVDKTIVTEILNLSKSEVNAIAKILKDEYEINIYDIIVGTFKSEAEDAMVYKLKRHGIKEETYET